jgi:hypothetical protein
MSDQRPNDCEEETANDGDELGGMEKEMDIKMIILRFPDLHKRSTITWQHIIAYARRPDQ